MTLTFNKKLLRWICPLREQERQDFRMALSKTMANAEDITRTVKLMNGHMAEHIAEWKREK